jgi:hypothetical protein
MVMIDAINNEKIFYSETRLQRTAWDQRDLFVITGVRYNRVVVIPSYSNGY